MKKRYFVHSTTSDGLLELLNRQGHEMAQDDYLSVSSLGCQKYLEKGFATVFVLVSAATDDIDFEAPGDVGWKGGTPRNTTYDEIGLTAYQVEKIIVPDYYGNNRNAVAMALLAQMVARDCANVELDIDGPQAIKSEIDSEFDDLREDGMDPADFYEMIEKNYAY